jgi:hypothetical protein
MTRIAHRDVLRAVDSVQQLAGVADQDNTCINGTRGCPGPNSGASTPPCATCFFEGGDHND